MTTPTTKKVGNSPVEEIKVTFGKDGLTVDPADLAFDTDRKPSVIIWRGDGNVDEITDISFDNNNNPRGQITQPQGAKSVWVSVNRCSRKGDWKYSISAVPVGGNGELLDPMIRNQ